MPHFKKLIPLAIIMAFLPIALHTVSTSTPLRLLSKADASTPLRIWTEPANTTGLTNSQVLVKVYASYDSNSSLLQRLSVELNTNQPLNLSKNFFVSDSPFAGKILLGESYVSATTPGTYSLDISKDRAIFSPNASLSTQGTTITFY